MKTQLICLLLLVHFATAQTTVRGLYRVNTSVRLTGRIPFDPGSLRQLNSPAQPWTSMFTNTLTSTVENHYAQLFTEYDNIYEFPASQNPTLNRIDYAVPWGGYTGREMKVYATDRKTGVETLIWTMPSNGSRNQALTTTINPITLSQLRFHIKNNGTPLYFRMFGAYNQYARQALPKPTVYPLKNQFGVNAFEWNFLDGNSLKEVISEARYARLKEFSGGVRHYLDWARIEPAENLFRFNPTTNGGFYYDNMYARAKADGLPIYPCIKTVPDWLLATYPDSAFGGASSRHNEVPPVVYGSSLLDPASYSKMAQVAFQMAARYGYNTNIDASLILTNTDPIGTYLNAPRNEKKVGLGYIDRIECDNERDKWWKGRNGYQSGREFAANLSAFYDGHKKTMGAGMGAKNADPAIQVLVGGVASMDVDYVIEMIRWSAENRGYRPDGTVNLPFDTYVYHKYIGNGGEQYSGVNTEGIPLEKSSWLNRYTQMREAFFRYAGYIPPIICNEWGYDWHPDSPLNAPAIGAKPAKQVTADWLVRGSLLLANRGQQSMQLYWGYDQGSNGGQFGTMGLIENDNTRRPFGDYIVQINAQFGNYLFSRSIAETASGYVLRGEAGGKVAYALWMPTANGSTGTYTLTLPGVTSITVYKPVVGASVMSEQTIAISGSYKATLTETPSFIKIN